MGWLLNFEIKACFDFILCPEEVGALLLFNWYSSESLLVPKELEFFFKFFSILSGGAGCLVLLLPM